MQLIHNNKLPILLKHEQIYTKEFRSYHVFFYMNCVGFVNMETCKRKVQSTPNSKINSKQRILLKKCGFVLGIGNLVVYGGV